MMKSDLYLTITLSWIFIVLAHWNNSLPVDMSFHLDTLSWFRANQYLILHLNTSCCINRETAITNFSFWFDPTKTQTYHTWDKHMLTITFPLRFFERLLQISNKVGIFTENV